MLVLSLVKDIEIIGGRRPRFRKIVVKKTPRSLGVSPELSEWSKGSDLRAEGDEDTGWN